MKFDKEFFDNLFTTSKDDLIFFLNIHGIDTSKYSEQYKKSLLTSTLSTTNDYPWEENNDYGFKYPFRLNLYGLLTDSFIPKPDTLNNYEFDKEILEVFKKYFTVAYSSNLEGESLNEYIKINSLYTVYLKFKE